MEISYSVWAMALTLKAIVERRLSELKKGPVEFAVENGLERTFVRDIVAEKKKRVLDYQPLAKALGLDAAAMARGEYLLETGPTPNAREADAKLPPVAAMPRDIPVLGTVAGADFAKGAFQLEPGPVDFVRRPPALAAARDVYALYVEGESMVPKFEPGELVYVNPMRPVRPGDYVVIQEPVGDEEKRAFIKLFVKRAGEWVVVRQHNPEGEMRFKATAGLRLHKVLTTADLLGS